MATLPNFGHDKLAMFPKFGHGNRAMLPNCVLGNRAMLSIMALPGSKDTIWKRCPVSKDTIWNRCPISMAKFRKHCQFIMSRIRKRCHFWKKCSTKLVPVFEFLTHLESDFQNFIYHSWIRKHSSSKYQKLVNRFRVPLMFYWNSQKVTPEPQLYPFN